MNKKLKRNIMPDDVFHARWKQREWGDHKNHCFEGIVVAMFDKNNELWLVDTFWGIKCWDNKKWRYANFVKLFNFTFYCNLKELQKIGRGELDYYDDKDVFYLHEQHACCESCRYFYIKKGTKRSQQKMLTVLQDKIDRKKQEIQYATDEIKRLSALKVEVEKGNLDIYI